MPTPVADIEEALVSEQERSVEEHAEPVPDAVREDDGPVPAATEERAPVVPLARTDTGMDVVAGVLLVGPTGPVAGAPTAPMPAPNAMHLFMCVIATGVAVVLAGAGFWWWTPLYRM